MAAIAVLSRLISCNLSCLALVATSAFLIAACTFSSFSFRKASKRCASSCSICSLFFSASSRCDARSSSLRISARLVSRLIWTRNISRFFWIKSAMTSFSRRRWSVGIACCAAVSPWGGRARRSSAMERCPLAELRLQKVVFSATLMCFSLSRSSALRVFSDSRMRNTSSSGGSTNGFAAIRCSCSDASCDISTSSPRLCPRLWPRLCPRLCAVWDPGRLYMGGSKPLPPPGARLILSSPR
mmetsp:Transcript_32109/g.83181  ORF Transcript_32109/g.83181 Transcript_32109/m.83181 type:complete len:241 (+) Transcript_32109:1239-1961(+)